MLHQTVVQGLTVCIKWVWSLKFSVNSVFGWQSPDEGWWWRLVRLTNLSQSHNWGLLRINFPHISRYDWQLPTHAIHIRESVNLKRFCDIDRKGREECSISNDVSSETLLTSRELKQIADLTRNKILWYKDSQKSLLTQYYFEIYFCNKWTEDWSWEPLQTSLSFSVLQT